MSLVRNTPLRGEHEALGAKMVEFAGWLMPVQYQGVKEEHLGTRQNVGIFDVSHMGEIRVRGPQSLKTLQWITTNDVAKLQAGQAQYSLFPNNHGGVVDDLIVYCVQPGIDYLLCVNAANTDKDWAFVQAENQGAELENQSDQWSQIAVQGPQAMKLLSLVFGAAVVRLPTFHFAEFPFQSTLVFIARTGYTGEDGVEIFVKNSAAVALWRTLLDNGAGSGVCPVGLAARDTLRTEMKYSLYGNEIDDTTNPYAAGLGWVVKPQVKDFVGKQAILTAKDQGLRQKLVGFILQERGIPRHGYGLMSFDKREIGKVTSGTMSPSLGESIGIAYVDTEFGSEGSEFLVDIRGRGVKAKVVKTPFVTTGLSHGPGSSTLKAGLSPTP